MTESPNGDEKTPSLGDASESVLKPQRVFEWPKPTWSSLSTGGDLSFATPAPTDPADAVEPTQDIEPSEVSDLDQADEEPGEAPADAAPEVTAVAAAPVSDSQVVPDGSVDNDAQDPPENPLLEVAEQSDTAAEDSSQPELLPSLLSNSSPLDAQPLGAQPSGAQPTDVQPSTAPHDRAGKPRSGLKLAVIIVAVLLVLAAAFYVVYAFLLNKDSENAPLPAEVTATSQADVAQLTSGNCLEAEPYSLVDEVTVVPCSEPHTAQIVSEFTPATTGFPEDEAQFDQDAKDACVNSIRPLITESLPADALTYAYLRPTQAEWSTIKRSICVVSAGTETLTGSLLDGTAELTP